MLRSTFSTTTIASSTTMPIASTMPKSDNALTEKPKASISENVPTIDTGTAISGMTDARHVCRNTMTTSTTRAIASRSYVQGATGGWVESAWDLLTGERHAYTWNG